MMDGASHTVYLGLGANLGDRDATLRAALAALDQPLAMAPDVTQKTGPTEPDTHATSGDEAHRSGALTNAHASAPIVRVERVSSVYDTAPLLVADQPRFHNIACMGQTWLEPLALLHALKRIEARLGRVPGPRYGPRALDIDILFYDDLILRTPELTIPHEHIAERAFVLLPLAEIAPGLRHPVLMRDIRSLATDVAGADVQRVGQL